MDGTYCPIKIELSEKTDFNIYSDNISKITYIEIKDLKVEITMPSYIAEHLLVRLKGEIE